jgi:hypothetical protein
MYVGSCCCCPPRAIGGGSLSAPFDISARRTTPADKIKGTRAPRDVCSLELFRPRFLCTRTSVYAALHERVER